jgi:acetolactate synthase-1/2/3 large subunit
MVECLENEGVTHVFGIPGEENIRLVGAISRSSITYVLVPARAGRLVHG